MAEPPKRNAKSIALTAVIVALPLYTGSRHHRRAQWSALDRPPHSRDFVALGREIRRKPGVDPPV